MTSTKSSEQQQEQYTTDEYEYILKKFRKAMIEHRGTGNVVADQFNKLLDIIFKNCPNWSVRRAMYKKSVQNRSRYF
jgi:hypothetical protein